jgi:hypothetical protein
VRVTGWSAGEGLRAELAPCFGLSQDRARAGLTGVTGDGPTVFVALARLTAETDPAPLDGLVAVRVPRTDEIHVRWSTGREVRIRLTGDGDTVDVGP